MLRRVFTVGLIGLIFMGTAGCGNDEKTKRVSLSKKEAAKTERPRVRPLRIAVGSMITPRAGFGYYKQLLDYIGEKLGRPVQCVDRENYAEINKLIGSGEIDAAFVCGEPYIDGQREFGMELLVAPQAYGRAVYHSYIIVPRDSPIESFDGLRGKNFAFVDPMSNTGKLVPTYLLSKLGETPDSYFRKYVYTYAHDNSIKAVARGIVDGAAVDNLVFEYLSRTHPEFTSKTKVIEKSPPYGIPPVVVPPSLDPKLKNSLREILLNVHRDEEGKEILKGMMIDKFVTVDDSAYDSIREMNRWVAEKNSEEPKTE